MGKVIERQAKRAYTRKPWFWLRRDTGEIVGRYTNLAQAMANQPTECGCCVLRHGTRRSSVQWLEVYGDN